jgi:hypothetical protein
MQAHQKHILGRQPRLSLTQCAFGGPGGIRTPVQNTFLSASYSNNSQYIFISELCQHFGPAWPATQIDCVAKCCLERWPDFLC